MDAIKLVGYSSSDLGLFKYKTRKESRAQQRKRLYELNPALNGEFFVYLVDGEKRYYNFYQTIPGDFPGHKQIDYLGIGNPTEVQPNKPMLWLYEVNGQDRYYEKQKDLSDPDLQDKKVIYKGIKFGVVPNQKSKEFQRRKWDRHCCYCEIKLTADTFTREHVIPKHKGGKIIKACCRDCNNEKGGLLLHTYIQVLNLKLIKFKPATQAYETLQIKIKNANRLAMELTG